VHIVYVKVDEVSGRITTTEWAVRRGMIDSWMTSRISYSVLIRAQDRGRPKTLHSNAWLNIVVRMVPKNPVSTNRPIVDLNESAHISCQLHLHVIAYLGLLHVTVVTYGTYLSLI